MVDGGMQVENLDRIMAALRPRLHRYCARMMGSAFDGEDIVQETLAKAVALYPNAAPIERPESWLFRIAHTTALDALRRRKRHGEADLAAIADEAARADARVSVAAGLAALLRLPATQRSSIVLADVLGYSLAETAEIIGATVPAVKAALHRGRARLRTPEDPRASPAPALTGAERTRLHAYADRFNARDFDALRALLAEDVRLDLANRTRLAGAKEVGVYFTRYGESADWHVRLGLAEGRPALLVDDPNDLTGAVQYVVLLGWRDGRIATIRDFRYATYVMESLAVEPL